MKTQHMRDPNRTGLPTLIVVAFLTPVVMIYAQSDTGIMRGMDMRDADTMPMQMDDRMTMTNGMPCCCTGMMGEMQGPMGMTILVLGTLLSLSTISALIALTIFLVRRNRITPTSLP